MQSPDVIQNKCFCSPLLAFLEWMHDDDENVNRSAKLLKKQARFIYVMQAAPGPVSYTTTPFL